MLSLNLGEQMSTRPRRWPVFCLLLVAPIAAGLVTLLHPGPSGHWSGHLATAAESIGVAVALVIGARLVWTRLPRLAVAALALVGVGLALEVVGNLRAAGSLWETTYDDAEAGLLGPLHAGYEWGHTVAAWGDTVVIVGSLGFALALGLTRRVGLMVAAIGGVVALFPPWIYPALSPLLLLSWLYVRPVRATAGSPVVGAAGSP